MASNKIIENKKQIVKEIESKIKNSSSVILFSYQGLSVQDLAELRRSLRNINSEIKVYKNTLVKRATDQLDLNLEEVLDGPNAILFGASLLEPIKALSEFSKKHAAVILRSGIIEGKTVTVDVINDYASIPSMEGLLTMLASGMIEHVKHLSIALNLYAEQIGENN